eukprot:Plantae.Rhodophyta-Palmaria_palmata.ctg4384.p3 GENE.Plantae.Rhodophyta-Palmaria_palmata.ctg4384~~Plantae.Rhodophyta-Palmaria_palmata.ctg4384.p3  ORF type:complete len:147 (+),score=0.55 Plantae.Rhodophyta-Palmaria_palmata.ctg4384:2563-3003(+)
MNPQSAFGNSVFRLRGVSNCRDIITNTFAPAASVTISLRFCSINLSGTGFLGVLRWLVALAHFTALFFLCVSSLMFSHDTLGLLGGVSAVSMFHCSCLLPMLLSSPLVLLFSIPHVKPSFCTGSCCTIKYAIRVVVILLYSGSHTL